MREHDASRHHAREQLHVVLALPLCPDGDGDGDCRPVRHIAYGGTSKALLVAASDSHVAVFTLEGLLFDMLDRLENPSAGYSSSGFERASR